MVDYRNSAKVHMLGLRSGDIEFILQVYGASAHDLMIIPNDIAQALAVKYPNHITSPFFIEEGKYKRWPARPSSNSHREQLIGGFILMAKQFKPYYTLLSQEKGDKWIIEFGDYQRDIVSEEMASRKEAWDFKKGTKFKIICTSVRQKDVMAVVNSMNAKETMEHASALCGL